MKIKNRCRIRWFVFGLFLLVLSGCFDIQKRIVWSPDGKLAAVLGDKGMYLCDADGKISELLVPNVTIAAWFSDSQRIAFSQDITFNSWKDVESLIPSETRDRIKQDAQTSLEQFKAGRTLKEVSSSITNLSEKDKSALGLYIKTVDGAQQTLGTNWSLVEKMEYDLNVLQTGTISNGTIVAGNTLARESDKISDIRVSPNHFAVAYTVENDAGQALKVAPADGSIPARVAADKVSLFSDWSPDSLSLVFIKTDANMESDNLALGSLSRRTALNADGRIQLEEKSHDLVGTLFYPFDKVRCLADGSIIFSSAEINLPSTTADMPDRQQLYRFDPERPGTLSRLIPRSVQESVPHELGLFEISPDGKRISLIDNKAFVVFNISGGTVDVVSNKADFSDTTPVWRSNELSFITAPDTNAPKKTEVVLWNNGKIRAISSNWPAEVREKLLDK